MKMKTYICPGCGATLTIDESSRTAKCEYCGQIIDIGTDRNSPERLQELAYAREKAKNRVKEEAEENARRRKGKGRLIAIGVIILFLAIAVFSTSITKPKCDPFSYVTVEFSGSNGEGTAELTAKGADGIDTNLIDYKLSSDRDLSEGDTVTVTASSSDYRLSRSTMQIEVTGLDLYLTDLDSLSEEALALIHTKTDEICDQDLYGVVGLRDVNEIVSREPACMFLVTDGKNSNILHDITKLVVTNAEGGETTVYISAYYENIIVRDGEEKSFRYDKCMYCGNQIWLGQNTLKNGLISGFDSLDSAETHVRTNMESDMKLLRRDF